jgi:V/A-type H+-transporting ATPase subunit A
MATKGTVKGIIANLVIVEADGPISQNEIAFIQMSDTQLMAEVIKVIGSNTYIQVLESTRCVKVGDNVEFAGHMLEVTLGPGILSRNYDGLQNDLDKMTGIFLKRGEYTYPLDADKLWDFTPIAKEGDEVQASFWLGQVTENHQPHKIMVPFVLKGNYFVKTIPVTMVQKWPVKKPIKAYNNKPRPFKLFQTGYRSIDFYNPLLEGGTGFVPGPFGTGKTVFQHTVSKQGEADIVVIAACGERANEVVEVFTEFPEIIDSRTGRSLMERTTIIANTSNMPVAAREASVYTAMTISEYYRNMGLKVLLLADSTSRWAQALREMSNRLEEQTNRFSYLYWNRITSWW